MNLSASVATLALSLALGLGGHEPATTAEKAEPAKQAQPATKPVEQTAPAPKQYTVVSGDNLSAIATSQSVSSWRQLWNANASLADPNVIYAGQVLTIPTGDVPDRPLPASVNVATLDAATNSTAARTATPAVVTGGNVDGILARVRQRESGGNYADNTGNGYYGAYQFSLSTWQGVGGSGLPSDASPAEQDARAAALYARSGCSPWPNTCY